MTLLITLIWLPILAYVSFAALYHVFLALAYLALKEKPSPQPPGQYRYILLIPAHNEQTVIGRMLASVEKISYDHRNFTAKVIADNCTDQTAEIVRQLGVDVMVRNDAAKRGKGHAIEWALAQLDLDRFDAVVIADADNIVDPDFFTGLNEVIDRGSNAIQCNNCLANPKATAFTKVIHLSRTVNNLLYHDAKYKLGLSSYLMGNGMCFTTRLLKKIGWTASSIAEDYEYYAKLVMENEMIGFAVNAKLYHQESTGLRHATEQRIRWSSGRFQVAKTYGVALLKKGLAERNFRIVDASFALLLPNLSMMVNLTAAVLLLLILQHIVYPMPYWVAWLSGMLLLEFLYFFSGIFLTRMPVGTFLLALAYCPLFLIWKGGIDVIGVLGRQINRWGRAERR